MTKDRTDQLRAEMAKEPKPPKYRFWTKNEKVEEENYEENVALTGVIVHPTITKAGKKEQDILKSIFKEVSQINEWIQLMKEDVAVLKNCQILVQQSTRTDPGMRDKIQDLMANIKSTSTNVRTSLQELDQKKEDVDNAIGKVVTTQHCLLKKSYADALDEYQQSLILHRKICEDILKKQLVIADKDISQEELGAILETEDIAVFVDNYMRDTLEARLILQDAQSMHKEITALEKEIQLMNELFLELSMHVTRQGELIDRIEYYIESGTEKTQKATKRLSKAHRMMANIRKRKLWIAGILLIIILVLALIAFI